MCYICGQGWTFIVTNLYGGTEETLRIVLLQLSRHHNDNYGERIISNGDKIIIQKKAKFNKKSMYNEKNQQVTFKAN